MSDSIKINGYDFTDCFKKKGVSAYYTKITGSNGGTMLDGTEVEDVLSFKLNYQRGFLPLKETRCIELLRQLKNRTVTVTLTDPLSLQERSFEAKVTDVVPVYKFTDQNGVRWFSLPDFTIKEL